MHKQRHNNVDKIKDNLNFALKLKYNEIIPAKNINFRTSINRFVFASLHINLIVLIDKLYNNI